jgi:hypothetical protein
MTPVKQEFAHNPPDSHGDCHRAALATILDLPLTAVPHIGDKEAAIDGKLFKQNEREFLATLGLIAVAVPLAGTLSHILYASGELNPEQEYFILGGVSSSECGHSVVANKDGIVHDPHPDNVGIIAPMDDGYYWLTYIVRSL